MSDTAPILLWFRRDLRLSDHPALVEAAGSGRPVIPVFIHDEVVEGYGPAPRWRLGQAVASFAERLAGIGSRLVLRRGRACNVLEALVDETGATSVWWSRAYDPPSIERDEAVKSALDHRGIDAGSRSGHLLFEPWTVETQQGAFYKVYTPYMRSVKDRDVPDPETAPSELAAPAAWPDGDDLDTWGMGAAMDRGAAIVAPHACVGEDAAQTRLATFIGERIEDYEEARDYPSVAGTSGLSENLTYGEVSPRSCWHAARRARDAGKAGAETFLQELIWREFAYHLLYHTPRLMTGNWREDWDRFPWNEDAQVEEVRAWKQGRTGIRFVDAAMREMYVTGRMHNRSRMIVASYLSKHLMCHWKIGMRWFEDHLIDWDPANNSMGWQWAAGSGPDAAPYFRVFNPVTQLGKFDKDDTYAATWIAEGQEDPPAEARAYFDAIPRRWSMAPDDPYPDPVVSHEDGRKRALAAYEARDF